MNSSLMFICIGMECLLYYHKESDASATCHMYALYLRFFSGKPFFLPVATTTHTTQRRTLENTLDALTRKRALWAHSARGALFSLI